MRHLRASDFFPSSDKHSAPALRAKQPRSLGVATFSKCGTQSFTCNICKYNCTQAQPNSNRALGQENKSDKCEPSSCCHSSCRGFRMDPKLACSKRSCVSGQELAPRLYNLEHSFRDTLPTNNPLWRAGRTHTFHFVHLLETCSLN